jgi:flagellar motor switch protein FliG
MPKHFYGSAKEDTNFWGSVIIESEDQEGLLSDLEKTNPGIAPDLRKFKFKLEDAAALPEGILEKVLAEADNEELGLALATCPPELIEFFMDAISDSRRELLEDQLASNKGASKEEAQKARSTLIKRFREVLG